MRNWEDLLPKNIATQQRKRERRDQMIRMRKAKFKFLEIAEKFGISNQGAKFQSREIVKFVPLYSDGIVKVNRLKENTPVENYLLDDSDVRRLAKQRRVSELLIMLCNIGGKNADS